MFVNANTLSLLIPQQIPTQEKPSNYTNNKHHNKNKHRRLVKRMPCASISMTHIYTLHMHAYTTNCYSIQKWQSIILPFIEYIGKGYDARHTHTHTHKQQQQQPKHTTAFQHGALVLIKIPPECHPLDTCGIHIYTHTHTHTHPYKCNKRKP